MSFASEIGNASKELADYSEAANLQKLPITADWWKEKRKQSMHHAKLVKNVTLPSSSSREVAAPASQPDTSTATAAASQHVNSKRVTITATTSEAETAAPAVFQPRTRREIQTEILESSPLNDKFGQPIEWKFGKWLSEFLLDMKRRREREVAVELADSGLNSADLEKMAVYILSLNADICTLNLSGNILKPKLLQAYLDIIPNINYLVELNLSNCSIKNFGPDMIQSVVENSQSLKLLNLSKNELEDANAAIICGFLENNKSVTHVDLSHNAFSIDCGRHLEKMISENTSMLSLNLSWNHLRLAGARCVAKGLKENVRLKNLNIAWNGFGDAGAEHLGQSMLSNAALEQLDVSSNRINDAGFYRFFYDLRRNSTLKSVKIGRNSVSTRALQNCLAALCTAQFSECGVRYLDVTNTITIKDDQLAVLTRRVQTEFNRHFQCRWGYQDTTALQLMAAAAHTSTHSADTHHAPNDPDDPNREAGAVAPAVQSFISLALLHIRNYVFESKQSLARIFEQFDSDGNLLLTRDEFKNALRIIRVPLNSVQMDALFDYLDKDKDREIDYSELIVILENFDKDF